MRPKPLATLPSRCMPAIFLATAVLAGPSLAAPNAPSTANAAVAPDTAAPASRDADGKTPPPLLTAPWPVSAQPFPKQLPRIELGEKPRSSLLDGAPGRRKDDEPEALERGRRVVPFLPAGSALTKPSFASPEALAAAVVAMLQADSSAAAYDSLLALGTKRADYDRFIWPELPQSRAITNLESRDGWMFHDADSRDAIRGALATYKDRKLKFVGLEYSRGIAQYTNFNLIEGVRIRCVDENGEFVAVTFAPVFLERNGRWKVYQYLDN